MLPDTTAPLVGNGASPPPADLSVLAPLAVSGLVVTKAALLAALRIYVPQLVGLEALPGDRYLLLLETSGSASAAREQPTR